MIVRTLRVPALAALLGDRNWWMPEPVARALRIAPASSEARVDV